MAVITSNAGALGNFTDGASWIGGVAPDATSDAVLQATTTSITIDTGSVCRSFTTTLFTGTLTHTAGVDFRIGDGTAGAGNVALDFGTFTYTLGSATTSLITFISTSATVQTVNFNGKTTGNVTFNAASGGSWQYTGGHTVGTGSTVTLTKGTLDINGQTCSWGLFDANSASARTLTLGSAAITCTGTGGSFSSGSAAGTLTVTANTATVTITGVGAGFYSKNVDWNGLSVVFSGSGNQGFTYTGPSTFTNVTRTGTAVKTDGFIFTHNVTVTGVLTINSNSDINRILVYSSAAGTARTITAASVVLGNTVDFQDITGAGAATWTVAGTGATAIGDCGGNSGITATSSSTQTSTGTASFTWSTHGWTSRVPLPQDDVVINNSFVAGRTVTADMPRLGRNITWAGATGTPAWASSNLGISVYGSITLISDMTISGTGILTLAGRGSFSITSATRTFTQPFIIAAPTGTYSLNDAAIFSQVSSANRINNGTFVTNSYSVSAYTFIAAASTTVTLGNTIWTFLATTTGSMWSINSSATYSDTGATFICPSSTVTRLFDGGGKTYGTLTYTVAGSTGILTITGSNSFAKINFSDATNARTLQFTAGTITTIRDADGFDGVVGTSGKLMTIDSATAATHALIHTTGQVATDYLSVKNSVASGGTGWYAGTHSTDVSGNTGWTFTDPPTSSFNIFGDEGMVS